MIRESLSELPWHDAVILEIHIDRRHPGEVDEIALSVLWPDGRWSCIKFVRCYALDARMNFGIVAAETVRSVVEEDQSEELRALREKWARLGVDLSELKCFRIETNSTASAINIYAEGWRRDFDGGTPRP